MRTNIEETSSKGRWRSAPPVSVIIPHFDDLRNLEICLEYLANQTLPRAKFEIVVADNNSPCGLDEVRRICQDAALVVSEPVQGAGLARNTAIAHSSGRFLGFTDADCRPAPDWLERGLAALSTAQLVGGRVHVFAKDDGHPTGAEAFEKVFAFNFKRYVEQLGFCGTANMFVPREIFENVGPFRSRVTEDMDWGMRASAANYSWKYAEDVVVAHPARHSWGGLKQKARRRSFEDFAIACERPNGKRIWFLRSFAILGSPFAHWIVAVRSSRVSGLSQRILAVATLFRIRFWRFLECNRILVRFLLTRGRGSATEILK